MVRYNKGDCIDAVSFFFAYMLIGIRMVATIASHHLFTQKVFLIT